MRCACLLARCHVYSSPSFGTCSLACCCLLWFNAVDLLAVMGTVVLGFGRARWLAVCAVVQCFGLARCLVYSSPLLGHPCLLAVCAVVQCFGLARCLVYSSPLLGRACLLAVCAVVQCFGLACCHVYTIVLSFGLACWLPCGCVCCGQCFGFACLLPV